MLFMLCYTQTNYNNNLYRVNGESGGIYGPATHSLVPYIGYDVYFLMCQV